MLNIWCIYLYIIVTVKAVSRAVRGHLLMDAALSHILFSRCLGPCVDDEERQTEGLQPVLGESPIEVPKTDDMHPDLKVAQKL